MMTKKPATKPAAKPALEDMWTYQIVALADKLNRHALSVARANGLNLSQWRVLAAVADKPHRTAADVVAITPMDKGVVSRAVETLLKTGLLKKNLARDDRRRAKLTLTAQGRRIHDRIASQLNIDFATAQKSGLDLARLSNRLKKISRALIC